MIEGLLEGAAGGVLHARLDTVAVAGRGVEELLDLLAGYQRVDAQSAARRQEALAELDRQRGVIAEDWTREEVAAGLGVAPDTAAGWLAEARTLTQHLPRTWRLLSAGTLTWPHAQAVVRGVAGLTADETARVEEWVLRTPDLPVWRFRARVTYAVDKFAPRTVEESRQITEAERTAWHEPGETPDTGTLVVAGPIATTAVAWTILDDLAQHLPAGDRTVGQRRFDAFTDLVTGTRAWEAIRPVVEVTVPADTLAGGITPGHLAGIGPISADTARQLAHAPKARWRRLVTDPTTGYLHAYSDQTFQPKQWDRLLAAAVEPPPAAEPQYRPSAALARSVRARDRYCRFPALPATRPPVPSGPHPAVAFRGDRRGQPRSALRPAPPAQTRDRLDADAERGRVDHLDIPDRAEVHDLAARLQRAISLPTR